MSLDYSDQPSPAHYFVVSLAAGAWSHVGNLNPNVWSKWAPFVRQEGRQKLVREDSQAEVEMFRQDTVHHQESVEVY